MMSVLFDLLAAMLILVLGLTVLVGAVISVLVFCPAVVIVAGVLAFIWACGRVL